MRLVDRIKVARQNISAGKSLVWKMIFGMMFIVMLVISFTVLINSYFAYIQEFTVTNAGDCYYYNEYRDANISADKAEEMINKAIAAGNEKGACETTILYTISYNDDEISLETSKVHLQVDGQLYEHKSKYVYDNKFYEDLYNKSAHIDMLLYGSDINAFPQVTQRLYKSDYLIGRLPDNSGEIMLDTHVMQVYGISDYDNLLNSKVSITYQRDDGEVLLIEDYVLTGIFKSEIIGSREGTNTPDLHREHIYVNLKQEDMSDYYIVYGSERYYQKDYLDYVKNCDYVDELLRLDFDAIEDREPGMQLTPKGTEYCLLYWLMNDLGRLFIIVAVVISVIITFSIFYIFRFYKSRNEKYFSMLENIGMNRRDRRSIFAIEIGMIVIVATMLGIYLSATFLLLVNLLLKSILSFSISVNVPLCIVGILLSWIYFGVCMLLVQIMSGKKHTRYKANLK